MSVGVAYYRSTIKLHLDLFQVHVNAVVTNCYCRKQITQCAQRRLGYTCRCGKEHEMAKFGFVVYYIYPVHRRTHLPFLSRRTQAKNHMPACMSLVGLRFGNEHCDYSNFEINGLIIGIGYLT